MSAPLLPPGATPFERAMEAVSATRSVEVLDRLVPAIAQVWSPDTCPAPLLGYLAWSLSVDVWDDAWPEAKKREACRKAVMLHRLKTTVAGIRAHLELAGARLGRVIRPPAKGALTAAMRPEDREAWLAGLPQVRIYPFATGGIARHRAFVTGPGARRQFLGRAPLRRSRGTTLYGRRATFFDRDAEMPVTLAQTGDGLIQQVLLGRTGAARLFHGSGHGRGHLSATRGAEQLLTLRLGADAPSFAVRRSARPVDVAPQRVAVRRLAPAPRAFFGRQHLGRGGFLRASHGPLLIFDRIALNDPDRLGARRKVRGWHGRGRLGLPPFTAELRIDVPLHRPRRRSGRWHGVGHVKAASLAPLDTAIAAIGASKALRDTILIDTVNHAKVKFRPGLRFGAFRFGEIRKVA